MKSFLLLFLLSISYASLAQNKELKLKKGKWIAELALNQKDILPFHLIVEKNNTLSVVNGEERIHLDAVKQIGDSSFVRFPYFNSQLVYKQISKKHISGYWVNFNKGNNYRIPFNAQRKKSFRFMVGSSKKEAPIEIGGKWQIEFEPNTSSSYPAIGLFNQEANVVNGTFLTETGDYRYLAGNVSSDSLFLSCFDGSHAFLFKASLKGDSLKGAFNSGSHWKSEWVGVQNENASLQDPEKITYLKDGSEFTFQFKDLDGINYSYPNEELSGKVVIIQIMGTWCPNCLDETMYYKELHKKYKDRGLEIISIGYEVGNSFEDYARNIKRLKNKLNLPYTFLVGGPAKKDVASKNFSMLNQIVSFPTSIFLGKDGKVVLVHTGFNGPGTGEYYEKYKVKTERLIESLINR